MTISPPSDIILEVARAAEPTRLAEATSRLQEIARARGRDGDGEGAPFGTLFAGLERRAPAAARPFDADRARVEISNRDVLGAPASLGRGPDLPAPRRVAASAETPARAFEAMVLGQMVESILPDAESVFGGGSAGSIWKGFLAQEIGAELARAGGVGIADMVARTHPELDRVSAAKAALWPEHEGAAAADPGRTSGFFTALYRA